MSDLDDVEQELKLKSPIFQENLGILNFQLLSAVSSGYFERSHIPMKTNAESQNFDIFYKIDFLFPVSLCVMKFQKANKSTPLANMSLSSQKYPF